MNEQNEDDNSRRKFLTGAGLAGVAAVAVTPAAAKVTPSEAAFSPEQVSKLEEIVKNFITKAKATNTEPLSSLAMKGHGSHVNENGSLPPRNAPAKKKQG